MNKQQEELLEQILSEIITACYREMGEAWCKKMRNLINEIKNVGKP